MECKLKRLPSRESGNPFNAHDEVTTVAFLGEYAPRAVPSLIGRAANRRIEVLDTAQETIAPLQSAGIARRALHVRDLETLKLQLNVRARETLPRCNCIRESEL